MTSTGSHRGGGEAGVQLRRIRKPPLEGQAGQHNAPAVLFRAKTRYTFTGGWVDLGAYLDGQENLAPNRIKHTDMT